MSAALPDFADRSKWALYEDVNVFGEHYEKAPDPADPSKVKEIRVDRKKLLAIRDRLNARDKGGQLCPIAIGHTKRKEYGKDGRVVYHPDESEQPELVGYGRDFAVEYDKALETYVLRAKKWYVAKDREDEAKSYPRVSAEYYPGADLIDPISIIRRTPRLDLGQWTYGHHGECYQYAMGGWNVPDPVSMPNVEDAAMTDAVKKALMQCFTDPSFVAMMQAAMGGKPSAPSMPSAPSGGSAPSGASGASGASTPSVPSHPSAASSASAPSSASYALPGTSVQMTPEMEQFMSQMASVRATRDEGWKRAVEEQMAALRAENERAKQATVIERHKGRVARMVAAGVDGDETFMLKQFMLQPTDADCDALEQFMMEGRPRAPIGGDMLRTYAPHPEDNATPEDQPTEAEVRQIEQYCRDHHAECQAMPDGGYAKAFEAVKGKRRRRA